MSNQSLISRFRPGFIPLLSLLVCLLFLICIGPGSTQGLAAQVTLAWDANTDPAVAGYKLYYGTASRTYGTPVDVGKVTQYTLTGIQEGVNAYFAVTAYDASRKESAFSTELPCFSLVPAPCVNGGISPSSAVVDSLSMSQTFTVTPAANYKISAVTVDGASVGAVSSYTFSNVTANHTIAASFTLNSNTYTISASAGANGSISPSGSVSVTHGASQVFTITANTGYQVQNVLVDGAPVGAVASYTFTNVTAAHTIAASFVAKTYAIAASAGTNGSISPTGSVSVTHGASQVFTITANTGYQVQNVLVDGAPVGAVASYTFTNVTAAHTIAASFVAKTYAIAASAGTNGSISPTGSVSVTHGASQVFTITANTGYQVQNVLVDGAPVGAVASYTFTNVTAAHTIAASFVAKTYAIAASAGTNGSISPTGSVSVTHGASQVFTITANTGYQVQNVLVDGAPVGAVASYTFTNVTAAHTIAASFVAKTYAIAASAGTNGSISPTSSVSVTHGASQTFTITPSAKYKVSAVTVDGSSVGAVTSYTFSNVMTNHIISAAFAPVHAQSGSSTSFNSDDKPDILWRNTSTGQLYVWYMDGVTAIGADYLPTVPDPDWIIAGVGDFNGDGKPDILWRNTSSGLNCVWYMDGVTSTGWDSLPTVPDPNWTIAGVGDFNGDGKLDIIWRNTSSGLNCVWYMDGVSFTGWDSLPTVPDPNWTIAGVGDFNGDGKPDILWRNTSSGLNCVWYMDGATSTEVDSLPTVPDPNWTIAGIGDFNGDGKPDILWRNTSSGQNCVWYMAGVTFSGWGSLPTVPDPNWTIV